MKILVILPVIISLIILNNFAYAVDVNLKCNPNGFQCVNQTSFIICVDIGNDVLVPSPVIDNCPKGFDCIDNMDVPCKESTTTTVKPTQYIPPFKCTKSGKFPAPDCRKYYHCIDLIFWYQLKLRTCPKDLWFNQYSKKCVTPKKSRCKQTEY